MSQTVQQQAPAATTTTEPAKSITEGQLSAILDNLIEKAERSRGEIKMTAHGVEFGNFEGVQRYARMLCDAGCVPEMKNDDDHTRLARATMCILLGRRVGLAAEEAVTSIYVVNHRPQLFGDAPLAVCRQHELWDESGFEEYWMVNGKRVDVDPDPAAFKLDDTACIVHTLRKGAKGPKTSRFSVSMAKQAGLFGKNQSLYGVYPQRMIKFRARGYGLRDNFGDALKGIGIRELADPEEVTESAAEQAPRPGRHSLRPNGSQTPRSQQIQEQLETATGVPESRDAETPRTTTQPPTEQRKEGQQAPTEEQLAEGELPSEAQQTGQVQTEAKLFDADQATIDDKITEILDLVKAGEKDESATRIRKCESWIGADNQRQLLAEWHKAFTAAPSKPTTTNPAGRPQRQRPGPV